MAAPDVSSRFKKEVLDWVALDDKLKNAKRIIDKVRHQRNGLGQNVATFLIDNDLKDKKINMRNQNCQLRCKLRQKTTPLSKKFIKQCLMEHLHDPTLVERALHVFQDPRERMLSCFGRVMEWNAAIAAVDYVFSQRTTTQVKSINRKNHREQISVLEVEAEADAPEEEEPEPEEDSEYEESDRY